MTTFAGIPVTHRRSTTALVAPLSELAQGYGVVICLLAVGTMSGCAGIRNSQPPPPRLTLVTGGTISVPAFERVVNENIRKADVAGLSVAIINERRVVYAQHFGWKDKDAATLIDDSTAFTGGSLIKPIVAYLAVLLASEGQLDLDRPLVEFLAKPLHDHAGYAVFENEPRHRLITARLALSHSSGLPNLRESTAEGRLRIHFEPGSRFGYSGEGFRLLQLILETITKRRIDTLAREKVFGPFGMRHSNLVWRPEIANNVAAPHNEFGWSAEPDRPPTPDGAGTLLTTARDYGRFLAALLRAYENEGHFVRMMWTPQVRITSERMTAPPGTLGSDLRLWWALGWGVFETPVGQAVFHTGRKGGVQNYVVVFPDRGIGMVVLSNSDNFESVAHEIVAAGTGDRWSPFQWLGYERFDSNRRKVAPPRPVAITLSAAVIADYAGIYEFSPGARVHIKAEGNRLYASDDGASWDELLARSENVFFFKGRTLTAEFVRDESGRVARLEVENSGAKIVARRLR